MTEESTWPECLTSGANDSFKPTCTTVPKANDWSMGLSLTNSRTSDTEPVGNMESMPNKCVAFISGKPSTRIDAWS